MQSISNSHKKYKFILSRRHFLANKTLIKLFAGIITPLFILITAVLFFAAEPALAQCAPGYSCVYTTVIDRPSGCRTLSGGNCVQQYTRETVFCDPNCSASLLAAYCDTSSCTSSLETISTNCCAQDSTPEPPPPEPEPPPDPEPPPPAPEPIPIIPQSGPVPPPYVACNEIDEPEFHSLRPYQASPCNQDYDDLALYCGNDIIVTDTATITKHFFPLPSTYMYEGSLIQPSPEDDPYAILGCNYCNQAGQCLPRDPPPTACSLNYGCVSSDDCIGECTDNGDGTETCFFNIDRTRRIVVDLKDAYLPIMGNTEGVVNSQNQPDPEPITDKLKVNEYVSWYLSGVNERAEYMPLDVSKNCIGETTRKAGVCSNTVYNTNACLTFSPIPIVNPLVWADGVSSCAAPKKCCVPLSPFVPEVDILDRDKLINYSGPLKKLLSFESQQRIRIDEIDDAYASRNETEPDPQYQLSIPPLGQEENARHDQIVACVYEVTIHIPWPYNRDLVFGGFPTVCYADDGDFWDKVKEFFIDFLNLRNEIRLTDWRETDNLPPLPEDYSTVAQYLAALRMWRGDWCYVIEIPDNIPLIGGKSYTFCFDNPDPSRENARYWAKLFPYIPFVSTEDRMGMVEVYNYTIQPPITDNVTVIYSSITEQTPADLFFPHMQEVSELSRFLQQTYTPMQLQESRTIDSLATKDVFTSANPFCDIAQIRSNPGDNLFAGEIGFTLNYTAQVRCTFYLEGDGNLCRTLSDEEADCVPSGYYCQEDYGQADCNVGQICGSDCQSPPSEPPTTTVCEQEGGECVPLYYVCTGGGFPPDIGSSCGLEYKCGIGCFLPDNEEELPNTQSCTIETAAAVQTITKTPLADDVWARLVAGSTGAFRKMFPKIHEGAPVKIIRDIPAASPVTYSSPDGVIIAGNPAAGRTGGAELYFPHIGGIHQYFLQCIQTALRPRGQGPYCLSGFESAVSGPIIGSCSYAMDEITQAMQAAASKYGIPVSLLRAIFEIEGLDYIANPDNYVCSENFMGAAGLMQIMPSTYRLVTCPYERYDDGTDIGVCTSEDGKLSRCDVDDVFELAARVLLSKVGMWDYENCSPYLGSFPTDPLIIYRAACAYYGLCRPDALTAQYSYNLPCPKRTDGDMNYCDIVWNKMYPSCPAYPSQQPPVCPYW